MKIRCWTQNIQILKPKIQLFVAHMHDNLWNPRNKKFLEILQIEQHEGF